MVDGFNLSLTGTSLAHRKRRQVSSQFSDVNNILVLIEKKQLFLTTVRFQTDIILNRFHTFAMVNCRKAALSERVKERTASSLPQ